MKVNGFSFKQDPFHILCPILGFINQRLLFFCAANQNFDLRIPFDQIDHTENRIDLFLASPDPYVDSLSIHCGCIPQISIINSINKIWIVGVRSPFGTIDYDLRVADKFIQSIPEFAIMHIQN